MSATSSTLLVPSGLRADPVDQYLDAIGKVALISAEREVDLAKLIELGVFAQHKLDTETDLSGRLAADLLQVAAEGRKAMTQMIEANLRLVVSIAKKYVDAKRPLLEMIQVGNLGLIHAVEKFDYTKGYKFSTYATTWIRAFCQHDGDDVANEIHLPKDVMTRLRKLRKIERELLTELRREPTPAEIAAKLGRSEEDVAQLRKETRSPLSIDTPIGEDGACVGDLLEDQEAPNPTGRTARTVSNWMLSAMDTLSPIEQVVCELRWGLYTGNPLSQQQVGGLLRHSPSWVAKIEQEALATLRKVLASRRRPE